MKIHNPNHAFSLLELIASIALIAIVSGYLLTVHEMALERCTRTTNLYLAQLLAKQKMEEIYLQGLQNLPPKGNFSQFPQFHWKIQKETKNILPTLPLTQVELHIQFQQNTLLKLTFWYDENTQTKNKNSSPNQ